MNLTQILNLNHHWQTTSYLVFKSGTNPNFTIVKLLFLYTAYISSRFGGHNHCHWILNNKIKLHLTNKLNVVNVINLYVKCNFNLLFKTQWQFLCPPKGDKIYAVYYLNFLYIWEAVLFWTFISAFQHNFFHGYYLTGQ